MINLVLGLYNCSWRVALPFLRHSPRIKLGWRQRTLGECAEGPFDLWIQAASGGESMLTNMVLERLETLLPRDKRWRVLATSGTKQGIDSLCRGRNYHQNQPDSILDITIAYFPFDAPVLMQKAFARFSPRLAIIIETELWPGFLIAGRKSNVPVLLINGRMSEKSYRAYRYFSGFFKKYGPIKILAISSDDGKRYAEIVGPDRVVLMNNLKFDRIGLRPELPAQEPIGNLLGKGSPFILLGSIRRQEEGRILKAIIRILAARPDVIIGLFPKHIERADHWLRLLKNDRIRAVKRSEIRDRQVPGSVIVWDVFGELANTYGYAGAAFVGGSLENLGGQNFLEPLVFGVRPIIGPYWKNFSWVGRDIISSGLVQEVADEDHLVVRLLTEIDAHPAKDEVARRVQDFFAPRRGGTLQVCQQIIAMLHCSGEK